MKAIYLNGPAGFVIGSGGVKDARLVKLSSGKIVHCTADSGDEAVGATLGYGDEGEAASIDWITKQGTLRVVAAGAISREADAYQAADGKVQALPAESVDEWESGTEYSEGDLIKPTSGNDHYYKATSGGTSDGSSEPTWPTDGTTVDDGTVTWQDMGSSKYRKAGKTLQAASGDGSVIGLLPYKFGEIINIAE